MEGQEVKVTKFYVRYKIDGEEYIRYFGSMMAFLNYIIKEVAYADLYDDRETLDRVANGYHYEYYGWMPDMHIRFVNADNREEILWDGYYPEYEH